MVAKSSQCFFTGKKQDGTEDFGFVHSKGGEGAWACEDAWDLIQIFNDEMSPYDFSLFTQEQQLRLYARLQELQERSILVGVLNSVSAPDDNFEDFINQFSA